MEGAVLAGERVALQEPEAVGGSGCDFPRECVSGGWEGSHIGSTTENVFLRGEQNPEKELPEGEGS